MILRFFLNLIYLKKKFSEKHAFSKIFLSKVLFLELCLFFTQYIDVQKEIWPKPKSKLLFFALANTVIVIANITILRQNIEKKRSKNFLKVI